MFTMFIIVFPIHIVFNLLFKIINDNKLINIRLSIIAEN